MFKKTRIFTPGPTPLLPQAIAAAATEMHHRTPEFRALFAKVRGQLQEFAGTKHEVVILACSGTGAMEAAVTNLTSPGDRVLVLSAGKFGERWIAIAQNFGLQVDTVKKPYGETFTLDEVRAVLKLETRCVYMQSNETSTTTRHDVRAIAELLREQKSEALLVVDGITGLGTTHYDLDGWGVDVMIGGSQKALMVPPGLAYLSVSARAWERMEGTYNPRYYFDLRRERKSQQKGESAFTPAISLIAGLGAALDYIAAQAGGDLAAGRDALIDNAELCAEMTRAAAKAMGMKLFSASPGAAATAICPPAGTDSTAIVKDLKQRFGAIVADGQGEMKGQMVRIAHLGYFDPLDTLALMGALEQTVKALGVAEFAFGAGLAAAQNVLSQSYKS